MASTGFSYFAKVAGAVGIGSGVGFILGKAHRLSLVATTQESSSSSGSSTSSSSAKAVEQWRYLAVYLTPESRKNLQSQLTTVGLGNTHEVGARVVIKSALSPQDVFLYQPLFGERAAFRIKGVVQVEGSKLVVGVGRVSTVAGELLDDDCEASVTLYPKPSSDSKSVAPTTLEERAAMDLPTRLKLAKISTGTLPSWQGPLPPVTVVNQKYSAKVAATYTGFDFSKQIVVDGYICSSDLVDEHGRCTFDRSTLTVDDAMPPAGTPVTESSTKPAQESTDKDASAEPADEDASECPVCRFMKGGPCKESFLLWDACIQSISESDDVTRCFPQTIEMMRCMREYEYYDIMTANSEEKMLQVQAQPTTTETGKSAPPKPAERE